MNENYNKQLRENLKIVLILEWVGIHIEDTKQVNDEYGLPSHTIYYFSVPEKSTIEIKSNKELNEQVKTAEGLIALAKEEITDMVIDSYKNVYGDDEFITDIKENISNYVKFYAKVRDGEIWTKEKGKDTLQKITNEVKTASKYKEV